MEPVRKHLRLLPTCHACCSTVAPNDSVVALLSNVKSTSYNGHTTPFLFPPRGYHLPETSNLDRSEQYSICRFVPCQACAKSIEAFAVHTDCLKLFRDTNKDVRPVWTRAAWKNPWRMASRIYDNMIIEELDSDVLFRIAGGLGIPQLRKLPLEVLWLIKNFSRTATLWRYIAVTSFGKTLPTSSTAIRRIPISEVYSWQRGSLIEPAPGSETLVGRRFLRVCMDVSGIRTLERTRALDAPNAKYCREFIVEDERSFDNVIGEFNNGLLRLHLPPNHDGFSLWDTPCPPNIQLCQFYPPQRPRTPARFRTLDLAQITGLTFFFNDGALYGIHGHTKSCPSAASTFQTFPERLQPCLIWIYLPLTHGESVSKVKVLKRKRFVEYFDLQISTNHKVCYLGQWVPKAATPLQLGHSPPSVLIFEDPYLGKPIPSIAVYCDGSRTSECATESPQPPISPLKQDDVYHSCASLNNVASVLVFNDASDLTCKGILLLYIDGSQQALGQCRIGTCPGEWIDSPLMLYYRQHKSGVQIDFATHGRQDLDWSEHIHQAMRGQIHFWFNSYSAVLSVEIQV